MAGCFAWLQLAPVYDNGLTSSQSANAPRSSRLRLILDAGHGGKDSGAMRNGVQEKDLTLDLAQRVERIARAQGFGTIMTRRSDEWISLGNRAAVANRENDCIFVSIHFDEGGRAAATGVQTFYAVRQVDRPALFPTWVPFLQPAMSEAAALDSQSLAGFVQEALVTKTQAFNRGTRAEQFYVVANVRHPAVLIEGGFLTNNDDLTKVTNEQYREQLASAITEGLVRYRETRNPHQATLAVGTANPE